MKKLILFSVLVVIAIGSIFAQEKYDGSFKNTIFFSAGQVGYERALNQSFSIGAEAGINYFGVAGGSFVVMPLFADAFARWYPWQRILFVNLGLGISSGGFATGDVDPNNPDATYGGFLIKPQVGWKIDIGKAGGWIFETRIGAGIAVGGDVMLVTIQAPLLLGRTF